MTADRRLGDPLDRPRDVLSILAALFLLAGVAAYYRGPYRDDDDLSDTRPRRPSRRRDDSDVPDLPDMPKRSGQ